jgi:nickel transport protein
MNKEYTNETACGFARFALFGNFQFVICNLRFAVLLLILSNPSAIFAHSMDVFATVEGQTIKGKAQYHDGTPAKNCEVRAFDPWGEEIVQTKTDAEGKFTLTARFRCDYRLLVDAGDGHGGDYTISAALLPADLPSRAHPHSSQPAHSDDESNPQHSPEQPADAATADAKLHNIMLTQIHADIDALQEQLNNYEHRLRFRDILGGIGFIIGIVGVAYGYYCRGLMRNNRQTSK